MVRSSVSLLKTRRRYMGHAREVMAALRSRLKSPFSPSEHESESEPEDSQQDAFRGLHFTAEDLEDSGDDDSDFSEVTQDGSPANTVRQVSCSSRRRSRQPSQSRTRSKSFDDMEQRRDSADDEPELHCHHHHQLDHKPMASANCPAGSVPKKSQVSVEDFLMTQEQVAVATPTSDMKASTEDSSDPSPAAPADTHKCGHGRVFTKLEVGEWIDPFGDGYFADDDTDTDGGAAASSKGTGGFVGSALSQEARNRILAEIRSSDPGPSPGFCRARGAAVTSTAGGGGSASSGRQSLVRQSRKYRPPLFRVHTESPPRSRADSHMRMYDPHRLAGSAVMRGVLLPSHVKTAGAAEYSSSEEMPEGSKGDAEHSRVAPLPSERGGRGHRRHHSATGTGGMPPMYLGGPLSRSSDFASPMSLVPDCAKCGITVYFYDEVIAQGRRFHKRCFKCSRCHRTPPKCALTVRNDRVFCFKCFHVPGDARMSAPAPAAPMPTAPHNSFAARFSTRIPSLTTSNVKATPDANGVFRQQRRKSSPLPLESVKRSSASGEHTAGGLATESNGSFSSARTRSHTFIVSEKNEAEGTCEKCSMRVLESTREQRGDGKWLHRNCNECSICGDNFGRSGVERAGLLYCRSCYRRVFSGQKFDVTGLRVKI